MTSLKQRYRKRHFQVVNAGARAFGVGLIVFGSYAVLTFAAFPEHMVADLVLGLLCLGAGVAFLKAKPIDPTKLFGEDK